MRLSRWLGRRLGSGWHFVAGTRGGPLPPRCGHAWQAYSTGRWLEIGWSCCRLAMTRACGCSRLSHATCRWRRSSSRVRSTSTSRVECLAARRRRLRWSRGRPLEVCDVIRRARRRGLALGVVDVLRWIRDRWPGAPLLDEDGDVSRCLAVLQCYADPFAALVIGHAYCRDGIGVIP